MNIESLVSESVLHKELDHGPFVNLIRNCISFLLSAFDVDVDVDVNTRLRFDQVAVPINKHSFWGVLAWKFTCISMEIYLLRLMALPLMYCL